MFTGIIEETGRVRRVERGGVSGSLTIEAKKILEDMRIGDSIAVNGICLTVREFRKDTFTVDVMHETFTRSCALNYQVGTRVNLERAMAANGRFGGHIVTGHIDGMGRVQKIYRDGNAVWYEIAAPPHILRYVVEKGSIAVNGVSLTVANVGTGSLSVSIIPHTRDMTTMSELKPGDGVNLENDCIGKYVEKLLDGQLPIQNRQNTAQRRHNAAESGRDAGQNGQGRAQDLSLTPEQYASNGITEDFLLTHGFL